jgi:2Fe-2S ferredoxin
MSRVLRWQCRCGCDVLEVKKGKCMVKIVVTDRAGATHIIQGDPGNGLMEALRDSNMDLEATCGGSCSCATCQVFVDPFWASKLPAPGPGEIELMQETSCYKADSSRLSCQVILKDELDGIAVTLAPSA